MNVLQDISQATSAAVAGVAPALVTLTSGRARFSGLVWRPDLVVTADEALPDEGEVRVTLAGGTTATAVIAGRDAATDIAVLRLAAAAPAVARLSPAAPAVGALAIAVGASEGMPVAALGIVSVAGGPWRSLRGGEIAHRIELDLRARRAMEGGLVLDAAGAAFGMLVAGPRRRALVIPAATIERVADRLASHGRMPRGWLGLALQPVRVDGVDARGLMVVASDPKGPGADAGIRQGDVLTAWNGAALGRGMGVARELGADSVGRTVVLDVRRGGETRQVSLTIGERPEA